MQTQDCDHTRREMTGKFRLPVASIKPPVLDVRKVCGRRAAMELEEHSFVNLGFGIPEWVSLVGAEEGIADQVIFSVESGPIGGVPLSGQSMGSSYNYEARYKTGDMFDLVDGGCLAMTCLGAAQIDEKGNVNVSKFNGRMTGPGGFVNISQTAKKVCFVGTFTAGGFSSEIKDGSLSIVKEGKIKKYVKEVEQITFSGEYALESGQEVLYISERAVFKLTDRGVMLIEIAPGVDIEKDILGQMEFRPVISDALKTMDERIFKDMRMGLELKKRPL